MADKPAPLVSETDKIDLRALIDGHTGVRIFQGAVYCDPCGKKIWTPTEGIAEGGQVHGTQTVIEAAHAHHLAAVILGALGADS